MNKKQSLSLGYRLTASFCGVIILGLIGYFHTVRVLQTSEQHNRLTNEIIHTGIAQTKDVALASQQMSANATEFVYSGDTAYLSSKRQSDREGQRAFTDLQSTLAQLPNATELLKLADEARHQDEHVCKPLEDQAMQLAATGRQPQAQALFVARYAASRSQLDRDISELVDHLRQYQTISENVEAQAAREAVLGGWVAQALIVAISLLVTCRMSRITSSGITQIIGAEEDARSAREMLQLIMDNIPQKIYWKDTKSVYLGCNQNFARAARLDSLKEVAGKTDGDLPWSKEEVDRLRLVDQRVMAADLPEYHVQEAATDTEGRQSWAETNKIPLHDAFGKVVGILGTSVDITEQKQAEEALREGDARLRTVIASIPVMVFALDRHGVFTFCDGKGMEALGLQSEQIVGRTAYDVFRETPALLDHLHLALTGVPHAWTIEVNGRTHETQAMPLHDGAGELTGIVGAAYDVTDHKRLEHQLSHQAFHDALTGLPNRALFRDRLEHALVRARRRHAAVAVLFVDLDNFKVVNDSLGHQAGDTLLLTVTERLNSSLREGDTLARLGGDEFTILLEDVAGLETATGVADRIAETLREPILVAGHSLFVSASIGVAITDSIKCLMPEDHSPAAEAEDLLRDADIAMYQAKNGGKAGCVIFDRQMTAHVMERLELETEMRRVLDSSDRNAVGGILGGGEHGELVLHYQPIVCLATGTVREIEALVRWNHPRRGLIPPAKFIPLAEETGLIVPLGNWVLRQACLEAKRLQAEFPSDQPLVIGVNLSVRQLEQANLVETVMDILDETGLSPENLKLEITESVMMDRAEPILSKLHRLREMGIKLAIDDFGTGYSSMACLSDFPLDTLKIDRSFIERLNDPDGMAIVQAIVVLAQALHLQVTCEGIETIAQWEQLQTLACDRGQGYYFARPQTSEALNAILTAEAAAEEVPVPPIPSWLVPVAA